MKQPVILFVLLLIGSASQSQIGEVSPGNATLGRTTIGKGIEIGKAGIAACTPRNFSCSESSAPYIFTGDGNWTVPENWQDNLKPPQVLTAGSEIIIDPVSGGEAVLNIPQTITAGAKLTIRPLKKFTVIGSVDSQ